MTKYILVGGNDRGISSYPSKLLGEIPKSTPSINMLSCFFSVRDSDWGKKAEIWRPWFKANLGVSNYSWSTPDSFISDIAKADVIYLHGGETKLLINTLSNYPNLKVAFRGKTVIGSSAGANALAKKYWSSTYRKAGDGLGLVNVNIMVHYGALDFNGQKRRSQDWKDDEQKFLEYIDGDDITYLEEGELKVFEVNN